MILSFHKFLAKYSMDLRSAALCILEIQSFPESRNQGSSNSVQGDSQIDPRKGEATPPKAALRTPPNAQEGSLSRRGRPQKMSQPSRKNQKGRASGSDFCVSRISPFIQPGFDSRSVDLRFSNEDSSGGFYTSNLLVQCWSALLAPPPHHSTTSDVGPL